MKHEFCERAVPAPSASKSSAKLCAPSFKPMRRWALLSLLPLVLAGCGASQVRPVDRSPTPLVDPLPMDAGLFLDSELRQYVYKEKRWNIDWQVALGEAGVTHAYRMAKATFVTPRDAGGSLYQVTLRFRMNVHDSQGRLVDSLVYTGYGATGSGSGLGSTGPLTAATELALRDAGAKFLTEFPLQPVVQQVLRGEAPVPVPQSVPLPAPESPKESP